MDTPPKSALARLECPECGRFFDASRPQTICTDCNSPLLARYQPDGSGGLYLRGEIESRPAGMWRWAELLPVQNPDLRLSLGEGDTPLLEVRRFAPEMQAGTLFVKDESHQATGSFKARGMAAAIGRAIELGCREFVIPTAGNAGGALAAYTARARALGFPAKAHVFMPEDTPRPIQNEVRLHGAHLYLVEGLISDAGRLAARAAEDRGWFNVSTFKEPYRLEGKKIMGYELAQQFNWELPEVIIYPTGGGTGLVGMWKAFAEMEALGWISSRRPRMVSVQASGCAPVVKAFFEGEADTTAWEDAVTAASGLRVPSPFAGRLILRALRESSGTAVSVSDEDILEAQAVLGRTEGIFAAPEGAAAAAAVRFLLDMGWIQPHERTVVFNTGAGLKYV